MLPLYCKREILRYWKMILEDLDFRDFLSFSSQLLNLPYLNQADQTTRYRIKFARWTVIESSMSICRKR